MKIIFLGTNGWYSTKTGDTICTLIETKNCYIILDAGEGFSKLNKYVTKNLPVFLLLSHLHLDHVYGLHIIPRMKFNDRLTIVIPQEKKKDLLILAGSPFMGAIKKRVAKILPINIGKHKNFPFLLECQKLKHQDGGFGYRIDVDGKSVAYGGDTGYCKEIIELAKKSDILIHECTLKSGMIDAGWGHASPEDCAEVAKKSGAKKLMLTHFMPDFYPTLESREKAQKAAGKIFKNSFYAKDGLTIKI